MAEWCNSLCNQREAKRPQTVVKETPWENIENYFPLNACIVFPCNNIFPCIVPYLAQIDSLFSDMDSDRPMRVSDYLTSLADRQKERGRKHQLYSLTITGKTFYCNGLT